MATATAQNDKTQHILDKHQDTPEEPHLSRAGDANLCQVGHKIVNVGHLHIHRIDPLNLAENQLRNLEHCFLDGGGRYLVISFDAAR